jgi:uncharacterized protein YgbK (DUF1537 family)
MEDGRLTDTIPRRWLILADDLTGAADCAIAFVRRGLSASVRWTLDGPEDTVIAIDADSRAQSPQAAAAIHRRLVQGGYASGIGLFKKIDSTLRGQPAAELGATIQALRQHGRRALAVVAPAFPATGRTLERGAIHLHGQALEETPLWARDHSYDTANVADVLEREGLGVRHVSLNFLRGPSPTLKSCIQEALVAGVDALVCDATDACDLDAVARATIGLADDIFWTGSGGLAQALAAFSTGGAETKSDPVSIEGGILFVVGTIAEPSRAAAARLAADETIHRVVITPDTLRAGPGKTEWTEAQRVVVTALVQGDDVLVEIASERRMGLAQGAALAGALADLLRPAVPVIGAIFITGGETARALLRAFDVSGIRLVRDLEPGVPLGSTLGALNVPIITKAGAFGDDGTLLRSLHHFRHLRQREMLR